MPVGPDYVLGPGDDLTIYVWGLVDTTLTRTVDRNGQITLPKVGAIRVWGLTFSQADRLIREQLSRYFIGYGTSVTLGRLRTIRVNVVGEVRQPGSFTIGSLATLTNALVAAGGAGPTGSLRQIRLHRNGHVIGTMDFYDYLLRGDRTNDFRLESGDTIFVPPIGPVAGIVGEIIRPGIYEIRSPTRLTQLIELAGGVAPRAYLKRVQIVRAQPSAERLAMDVDLTQLHANGDRAADPLIENGDLVVLFQSDPRVYNLVNVEGAVKYPGRYELRPGMRLTQLLPPDAVLPEASTDRVEVMRRNPDRSVQLIAVNLAQAWVNDPTQDIALAPGDRVVVRADRRDQAGLGFATVTLNGEFRRPGRYTVATGETLSSVIRRAGGFTPRAYLPGGVFTRESLRRIEQEQLRSFVRLQEERLLADASATIVGADKDEQASRTQTLAAQRELLRVLASRVAVGRMVVKLDHPDRLEGTAGDLILEDGDSITVSQPPGSVLVLGAVRTSTSVIHNPGASIEYYLNRVGGLTAQADKREIHIVKADGSAVTGFPKLRDVEPGDTIVVPPKQEEKIRWLPTARDVMQIIGQGLISLAALAVLF